MTVKMTGLICVHDEIQFLGLFCEYKRRIKMIDKPVYEDIQYFVLTGRGAF